MTNPAKPHLWQRLAKLRDILRADGSAVGTMGVKLVEVVGDRDGARIEKGGSLPAVLLVPLRERIVGSTVPLPKMTIVLVIQVWSAYDRANPQKSTELHFRLTAEVQRVIQDSRVVDGFWYGINMGSDPAWEWDHSPDLFQTGGGFLRKSEVEIQLSVPKIDVTATE